MVVESTDSTTFLVTMIEMFTALLLLLSSPVEILFLERNGSSGISLSTGVRYVLSDGKTHGFLGSLQGRIVDWNDHPELDELLADKSPFVLGFESIGEEIFVARVTEASTNVIESYNLVTKKLNWQIDLDGLIGDRLQEMEIGGPKYDSHFRISSSGKFAAVTHMEFGPGWRTFEFEIGARQRFIRELKGTVCGYLGNQIVTMDTYTRDRKSVTELRIGATKFDVPGTSQYRVACDGNACYVQAEDGNFFKITEVEGKPRIARLNFVAQKQRNSYFYSDIGWIGLFRRSSLVNKID
jgi:hypothetical protein